VIAFDAGPKFTLAEIHVTAGAAAKLLPHDIEDAVRRHSRDDWGEVDLEGQQDNDPQLSGWKYL
jgi:hypothetical protein